ncbi:hypothetical protein ACQP2Y_23310 [Actinoplanes sp. CA-051413]
MRVFRVGPGRERSEQKCGEREDSACRGGSVHFLVTIPSGLDPATP